MKKKHSREHEELLVLQRGGQCDRSARVAREFKELEFRISDLDRPVAISYSEKRRWQNSIRKQFIL